MKQQRKWNGNIWFFLSSHAKSKMQMKNTVNDEAGRQMVRWWKRWEGWIHNEAEEEQGKRAGSLNDRREHVCFPLNEAVFLYTAYVMFRLNYSVHSFYNCPLRTRELCVVSSNFLDSKVFSFKQSWLTKDILISSKRAPGFRGGILLMHENTGKWNINKTVFTFV